ncbi:MAG: N-acetyltransferase [Anaerolineae bacterium]|nr:MAG: N-acetyltransferase [Anaerolineae bacterium]
MSADTASPIRVRPLSSADRPWANALLTERWGSTRMVTRGVVHDLTQLPGLVAWYGGQRAGLLLYRPAGTAWEIVSLDSTLAGHGVGTALLEAIRQLAQTSGCRRLWLITTNDNLPALRFYQKRGFHLVAVYPDALTQARRLKPEIPLLGLEDIPLRDELELEIVL